MSENTFNHKKMSIIEPYRIIGTEIANLEIGSINNPKFFKITAGQRQKIHFCIIVKSVRIITSTKFRP